MAVTDLFSKRQKRARGEMPDVYDMPAASGWFRRCAAVLSVVQVRLVYRGKRWLTALIILPIKTTLTRGYSFYQRPLRDDASRFSWCTKCLT